MSSRVKRQLKAIIFADIVGYTALMEANEQEALLLLNRFREALELETAASEGQIVQYYGDGALVIFDSSVDAVHCALRLQEFFLKKATIPVRIGVHTGDIVEQNGNVYGDSVNLASRIESCGVPGAILFSERVAQDLKGHPEFQFVSLGKLLFKNVEEPQVVYALSNPGLPVPQRHQLQGKLRADPGWRRWLLYGSIFFGVLLFLFAGLRYSVWKKPGAAPLGPSSRQMDASVAVLPFRWLSAASEEDYFAEGIAEAIRGKLSQMRGLRVTSMTSALPYAESGQSIQEIAGKLRVAHLLEGSVQKDSQRIQINVRLVDARADRQLWGRSFDEQLTDIFSVQNRIAAEVARALETALNVGERQRLEHLATQDVDAYEYYMAGRRDFYRAGHSRDTSLLLRSRERFQKAVQLDSNFAQAHIALAGAMLLMPEKKLEDSVLLLLERAVRLDPNNDQAYATFGQFYWRRREVEKAVANYRKAIELAPSNTNALMGLAEVLMAQRNFDQAIPMMMRSIALDPHNQRDPFNKELYVGLAGLYLEAHKDKEAEALLKRALELFPDDGHLLQNYRMLLLTTGRFQEAIAVAEKAYRQMGPGMENIDQLAICYLFAGRYQEAEQYYRQLYAFLDRSDTKQPSSVRTFRHRLAFALWQQGKKEEALRLVEEHLAAEKAMIAEGTLYRGQEYDIAAAYAFTGRKEAAYQWLVRMPYWSITYRLLRVDPLFDPLRKELRFQKIIGSKEAEVRRIREALEKAEQEEGAFRQLEN